MWVHSSARFVGIAEATDSMHRGRDSPFTSSASRHHLPFLQGFKVNVSDPLVTQDSLGHALPGSVGAEGWGMVSLFGEMPAAPRKKGTAIERGEKDAA